MPKSPAERAGIPLSSTAVSESPHPGDPAWKAWQAQVDAGRIGNRAGTSRAILMQHVRNEMVLLGRSGVLG